MCGGRKYQFLFSHVKLKQNKGTVAFSELADGEFTLTPPLPPQRTFKKDWT